MSGRGCSKSFGGGGGGGLQPPPPLDPPLIEWALSIGMVMKANKKALFVTFVDHVLRFEAHSEACFSPNATDSLCILVVQVP